MHPPGKIQFFLLFVGLSHLRRSLIRDNGDDKALFSTLILENGTVGEVDVPRPGPSFGVVPVRFRKEL